MRSAVILACICVLLTVVNARDIADNLSKAFDVPLEDATTCIRKGQASRADFDLLEEAVNYMTSATITDSNGRRAACALACIAQKKDMMTDSKLNMSKILAKVETYQIPDDARLRVLDTTEACAEQVKDVTDECQVVYEFVGCVVKKMRAYN